MRFFRRRRRATAAPSWGTFRGTGQREDYPESLGTFPRRPPLPQMFPAAPPDRVEPLPNPLDKLPPDVREAIVSTVGAMRRPNPPKEST